MRWIPSKPQWRRSLWPTILPRWHYAFRIPFSCRDLYWVCFFRRILVLQTDKWLYFKKASRYRLYLEWRWWTLVDPWHFRITPLSKNTDSFNKQNNCDQGNITLHFGTGLLVVLRLLRAQDADSYLGLEGANRTASSKLQSGIKEAKHCYKMHIQEYFKSSVLGAMWQIIKTMSSHYSKNTSFTHGVLLPRSHKFFIAKFDGTTNHTVMW